MTRLTSVFTTTCFMLAGTVALCADKPSEWDAPPPRDTRGPANDARGPRDQANQRRTIVVLLPPRIGINLTAVAKVTRVSGGPNPGGRDSAGPDQRRDGPPNQRAADRSQRRDGHQNPPPGTGSRPDFGRHPGDRDGGPRDGDADEDDNGPQGPPRGFGRRLDFGHHPDGRGPRRRWRCRRG